MHKHIRKIFREKFSIPEWQLPENAEEIYVRLVSANEKYTLVLLYIQIFAPPEIHLDVKESLMVLESSCQFKIGEELIDLSVGDYLEIPLNVVPSAGITSESC